MKKGKKKMIIKILCVIIFLGVIGTLTVVGINLYVTGSVKSRIVTVEKCKNLDADCIIVLGAGIRKDGSPTWILEDRIIVGDQLYKNGAASKIIMSGDHGRASHDEVNTMKDYAINENVQTFITTPSISDIKEDLLKKAKVFKIENGNISELI